MKQFFRRLHYLLNRSRFDRELASDMEFHREMAEQNDGRRFGSTLRLREEARDAWGWTWIERLSQDLRYSARTLRQSPGFTLSAILMLAIGIGVNVAAFGFFDLMVLRPLHVREPATLLRFHRRAPQGFSFVLPYPEMTFFREHSKTLSAVLGLNLGKLSVAGEDKQADAHFVTGNFFAELGGTARLGRVLDPVQDEASSEPVVVLSEGFWQRHYGADPSVIGKLIRLDDKPARVIGVASRQFNGLSLDSPDLWAPITQQPYFARGSRLLTDFSGDSSGVEVWGRLRPGVIPKVAEEELGSLAAQLRHEHPVDIWEKESLPSEPGGYAKSLMIGGRRGSGSESEGQKEIYPVAAMVGALCLMILSVACANLGSLLLARGVAREREIGIRIAVGAGSVRLVRQLFTESLVLALCGSALGLVLGYAVLRNLMALTGAPPWLNSTPDWRVAAFATGMGFFAAVLFGLMPALQLARGRHRESRVRHVLVGVQVAVSCVLLIVAGLLVRAFDHATFSDLGFDYRRTVAIDPGLASHGYSPARARAYLDTFQSRLSALPGVESVSLALSPPLGNRHESARIDVDGRVTDVQINRIDPRFFDTMHIPLLRGRIFGSNETGVILISASLARRWPTGDPLGRKFTMGGDYAVIGIAGNARTLALENSDSVEVYLPIVATDLPSTAVIVRSSSDPGSLARAAGSLAKRLDPDLAPDVQVLKNRFERSLQGAEYGALAVSILGIVALAIACLGIVGLVAFAVAQRTKEIGLRAALGAKPSQVLSAILYRFVSPVVIGLLAGAAGASALSQILRRVLYGISNLDPVTYITAIGIFAATAFIAALFPAVRALRIDPIQALRHD